MSTQKTHTSLSLKVGLFTLLGLLLTIAVTVFVNDRPFWWRQCQLVHINVEDATGLKTKSPIRSLGLQVGYLESVELAETFVRLGICITAPVEVLPTTRAYIRSEGFLGDKFVELKPMRYLGDSGAPSSQRQSPSPSGSPSIRIPSSIEADPQGMPGQEERDRSSPGTGVRVEKTFESAAAFFLGSPAWAMESTAYAQAPGKAKDIPMGQEQQDVQKLMERVDTLVGEMQGLTSNLKESVNPQEFKKTLRQLNQTLENASRTLSPGGGLNTTAQRTLERLEDGINQLREIIARVNRGEGSIGMLLNDPVYAQEIRKAIQSVNTVVDRLSRVRVNLTLGAEQIDVFGGRGFVLLQIWPNAQRYYRLGITSDPRGALRVVDYTTSVNGSSTTVRTTQLENGGLVLNAMLGRVFWDRLDLSVGLLHGDGALSTQVYLGPQQREHLLQLRGDFYTRGRGNAGDGRLRVTLQPFLGNPLLSSLYISGGVESVRRVGGEITWTYGAGITFDDDDLRVLFAFR